MMFILAVMLALKVARRESGEQKMVGEAQMVQRDSHFQKLACVPEEDYICRARYRILHRSAI